MNGNQLQNTEISQGAAEKQRQPMLLLSLFSHLFILKFKNISICLFLAGLVFTAAHGLSLAVASGGDLLVVALWLLITVVSLFVQSTGSRV